MACGMMCGVRRVVVVGLAATLLGLASSPVALAGYPDRPIQVIVPFPAGGGGDILARTVMAKVAEIMGQTIVIDNRAGRRRQYRHRGGSACRTRRLYARLWHQRHPRHQPDALQVDRIRSAQRLRPDFAADRNCADAGGQPRRCRRRLTGELLAYLKANPGKLNVATAGNGTSSHLAAEMFKTATRTDFLIVHYRGGALAMTDLISGQMQMMIEIMPNAMPQVEGDKLRPLAVSTRIRWPLVPDLPTLTEFGVDMTVSAWDAIFAPRGTPPEIIDAFNSATTEGAGGSAAQTDAACARRPRHAIDAGCNCSAHVEAELKRWGAVVRGLRRESRLTRCLKKRDEPGGNREPHPFRECGHPAIRKRAADCRRRSTTARQRTTEYIQALDNFHRVFGIRTGDHVVMLTDPLLDPRVVQAVQGLAKARGATFASYMGESTRYVAVPDEAKALLERADVRGVDLVCVGVRSVLHRAAAQPRAALGQDHVLPQH